ncbi:hypothetical protein J1605_008933 [Eschrichtius robustus]|uniref:Uncharacterized protein n=1 Tax=Eschrichtius robustus TaxID=9764 RepID=A0AB34GZ18_ESCRO|nr:hypothetical protein J1605_008933 [Eschrichtius robustus]
MVAGAPRRWRSRYYGKGRYGHPDFKNNCPVLEEYITPLPSAQCRRKVPDPEPAFGKSVADRSPTANAAQILIKTSGAITLVFVPLCSINSNKVVPRFERFGLGVLESSNPKM